MENSNVEEKSTTQNKQTNNKVAIDTEERIRILANQIIDRILEDQKNGKLKFSK